MEAMSHIFKILHEDNEALDNLLETELEKSEVSHDKLTKTYQDLIEKFENDPLIEPYKIKARMHQMDPKIEELNLMVEVAKKKVQNAKVMVLFAFSKNLLIRSLLFSDILNHPSIIL
jgi:hypothetical protein